MTTMFRYTVTTDSGIRAKRLQGVRDRGREEGRESEKRKRRGGHVRKFNVLYQTITHLIVHVHVNST